MKDRVFSVKRVVKENGCYHFYQARAIEVDKFERVNLGERGTIQKLRPPVILTQFFSRIAPKDKEYEWSMTDFT